MYVCTGGFFCSKVQRICFEKSFSSWPLNCNITKGRIKMYYINTLTQIIGLRVTFDPECTILLGLEVDIKILNTTLIVKLLIPMIF
ncbi:unnamed protein product [Rhizophagus irregularis]|nr:unnamed protein product [Rhizophagus irregularis]